MSLYIYIYIVSSRPTTGRAAAGFCPSISNDVSWAIWGYYYVVYRITINNSIVLIV